MWIGLKGLLLVLLTPGGVKKRVCVNHLTTLQAGQAEKKHIPLFSSMGCGASHEVADYNGGGRVTRLPHPGSWLLTPGPGVTQEELQGRRVQFWETRVSGHPQMWNNLRLVCEGLLAGDIELASTVLDSTGMRVPQGNLTQAPSLVVYDSMGAQYDIPRFVWSTPGNVISAEAAAAAAATAAASSRRKANIPSAPLSLKMRLAPSRATCEQDVPLALTTRTTVEEVKNLLHDTLMGGTFDMKPDASIKKPNVWSEKGGLPPTKQRIMFRCVCPPSPTATYFTPRCPLSFTQH